jgi:hypothetical protein
MLHPGDLTYRQGVAERSTDGPDGAEAGDEPDNMTTPSDRVPGWPLSAICAVFVTSVLVVVLLLMNLFGIQLGGDYDPAVGGNMAEWFEALATLLAIPAAVLFGVRQLQSTGAVLDLERRQLVAEELERAERRNVEQAILQRAVSLRVHVANLLDSPQLATEDERLAVERLVDEYRQRGWSWDATSETWRQGTLERSNAEQLAAEPSPLAAKPWFVALDCHNSGSVTVTLERWIVESEAGSTTVETSVELQPGDGHHHRLGTAEGLPGAHPKLGDAEASCAAIMVSLEGSDAAGRPFRIIHPHRR